MISQLHIPTLPVPLSTLHVQPCDYPRMTRGQDGSPFLSCRTLSFLVPCRFIPAHSAFILFIRVHPKKLPHPQGPKTSPPTPPIQPSLRGFGDRRGLWLDGDVGKDNCFHRIGVVSADGEANQNRAGEGDLGVADPDGFRAFFC